MKFIRLLALGAIAATCVYAQAQMEQHTNKENMVHDRGQSPVRPDTLQHGRPTPESQNVGASTLSGILIDGSCAERSSMNLRRPAETQQAQAPAQPPNAASNNPPRSGAVSAKGIHVDAATINAERSDVMQNQVPEMFERQTDPTCAVTGSTSSFALLLDDGRLLDLDEGGNTLAQVALRANPAGRAMLNGGGPGVKPRVEVKGFIRSRRVLITQDIANVS